MHRDSKHNPKHFYSHTGTVLKSAFSAARVAATNSSLVRQVQGKRFVESCILISCKQHYMLSNARDISEQACMATGCCRLQQLAQFHLHASMW